MTNLPPEKINQIKQIIHNRYNEIDIQSQIRDIIAEKFNEISTGQSKTVSKKNINQDLIVQEIRKKGIVDSIMSGLKFENHIHQSHHANSSINQSRLDDAPIKTAPRFVDTNQEFAIPLNKVNVDPSKRHLYLQILNGKAFLEYLTHNENENENLLLPGQSQTGSSYFTIYVHYRGQRFKTRAFSCSCEPKISEGFLLELHKERNDLASALMADSASLLSLCDPIHIVMIRTDSNQDSHLVSSQFLEWRTLLAQTRNKQSMSIELMGTGAENKIPAGILNVCLQLVPPLEEPLREDIIGAQLGLEHSKNTERERLFISYAKQWWKEYLEIRDDHKNRIVKIFAQDENGTNRSVCSYIKPMRTGRLLDTPRQAARFVSLIGYNKRNASASFGINEQIEQWMHLHTFLVKNTGDCENHSILLCNLLLGFGLDAYVCVGTKVKNQAHTWVVSISYDYSEVVFWESLTGNRYLHIYINPDDPPLDKNIVVKHPYKTIGCLFNHRSFYANIQSLSNVDTCSFKLKDQSKWKSMSEDAITTVCTPSFVSTIPFMPPLCQNLLDSTLISNDLERQLKALIVMHRQEIGLNTSWDDHLSYILSPALASYETERVTGLSVGNEEFDQAIRLAIPDGHSFKAFPLQVIHRNARKIFASCLKSPIGEEIVSCRGDQVKIALRVKVFTYPESTIATWIMLACRYKIII